MLHLLSRLYILYRLRTILCLGECIIVWLRMKGRNESCDHLWETKGLSDLTSNSIFTQSVKFFGRELAKIMYFIREHVRKKLAFLGDASTNGGGALKNANLFLEIEPSLESGKSFDLEHCYWIYFCKIKTRRCHLVWNFIKKDKFELPWGW